MKKILLLLLLSAFAAQAQDYQLLEATKRLPDRDATTFFAKQLVSSTPTKYRLFTIKESQNAGILRYRFVEDVLSDEDVKALKFTEQQRQAFITIDYSFYNAGEDRDAPPPDTITYKLNEITGAYPEIFAIWKHFFKPDADYELTKTDFKSQHLKDADRRIEIYIFQTETGWSIRNMSLL